MEKEKPLLDCGGRVNHNVKFRIKSDRSGIELYGFDLDGIEYIVIETIQYRPWNFGMILPGAGQLGIYKIKGADENEKFALIKDYRAAEGDWRISLLKITKTEEEMRNELKTDETYRWIFEKYLSAD